MANEPINPKNFPDGTTPSGSEIFPLYQSGWKKISMTVLKDWFATLFGSKAAEHTHGNKSTLDSVSGTNTGDQDLSGLALSDHNHSGVYDPLGAATGAVDTHEASFNHNSIVSDAPNDGKYYVRRNQQWEELTIT